MRLYSFARAVALTVLLNGATGEGADLLPDLRVRRSDLFDNLVTDTLTPGRVHLRLSNATMNVGQGKLYVYGSLVNGDGTQQVIQRIFQDDGSFVDVPAGSFVYHSSHSHVHIDEWAAYRVREILPGGGVGAIVAEGDKTSFCLLDLQIYDSTLPNFNPDGEFRSCTSTVQGLSVGWLDIYDKSVAGQAIDITDVPPGTYWLESEVDPVDHFRETNESNNVERIQITIGDVGAFHPDPYEPNNTTTEVLSRPTGAFQSPNLGPTNPKLVIENLTIHEQNDPDYFRFYVNSTGTDRDFVRIDFQNNQGNLDLTLLDSLRQVVAVSATTNHWEYISLRNVTKGWYYARITGRAGARSPDYTLTINPPANFPPSITVLTPEEGDLKLVHGLDLFAVRWTTSDFEGDPTWVSVYVNQEPELGGVNQLLPSSLNTPGELGFFIINSAELSPGTYRVYCEVTDGGTTRGSWSDGTVSFIELPDSCLTLSAGGSDCNGNGVLDSCDIEHGFEEDCNRNRIPDACDIASGALPDADGDGEPDRCPPFFHRGDADGDGAITVGDANRILDFLFGELPQPACMESADWNNDGFVDLSDSVATFNFLFQGGAPPVEPGPPGQPCGADPDAPGSRKDIGCISYEGC